MVEEKERRDSDVEITTDNLDNSVGESTEEPEGVDEMSLDDCRKLLAEKDREISSFKDKVLRIGAEFENFKKRMEREKGDYMKYALESFAKELLPFLDNLERAIQTAKENPDVDKIVEGLELTLNGYFGTLEKFGLRRFVAEGRRFDPNYHEALGVEEHDGVEENTVIKELLKGYALHERVIRPALVVVSKKGQKESGQNKMDA